MWWCWQLEVSRKEIADAYTKSGRANQKNYPTNEDFKMFQTLIEIIEALWFHKQ